VDDRRDLLIVYRRQRDCATGQEPAVQGELSCFREFLWPRWLHTDALAHAATQNHADANHVAGDADVRESLRVVEKRMDQMRLETSAARDQRAGCETP
jgi:hypothetical protein